MKAVFLDRDNTLIDNAGDLGDPEQVQLRPGVGQALRALHEEGFRLIVVTNQGGVARGAYTERDVDAVHQRIAQLVDESAGIESVIDRFYYCPYHPEGSVEEYCREHPWRKPQPGMLIQAARDLELDLADCWLIGDQPRDIEAGRAAGCRTVLLSLDADSATDCDPLVQVETMTDAAIAILESRTGTGQTSRSQSTPEVAGAGSPGGPGGPENPGAGTETSIHRKSAPRSARSKDASERDEFDPLRRAMHDLAEEFRSERMRRAEFTPMRMGAGLCELLVLLFGMLAILQLGQFESFLRWMVAAVLVQLVVIAILLWDARS